MARRNILNGNRSRDFSYYGKRIVAFFIDLYLSTLLLNLISILSLEIFGLTNESYRIVSYDTKTKIISVIASIISSLIYFVLIPHLTKKKSTLGMKIFSLEIKNEDGTDPNLPVLFKRFYLGSYFIQGILYSSFNIILQILLIGVNEETVNLINITITIGLSIVVIVSSILALKDEKGRTIQDRIGKTYVSIGKNNKG